MKSTLFLVPILGAFLAACGPKVLTSKTDPSPNPTATPTPASAPTPSDPASPSAKPTPLGLAARAGIPSQVIEPMETPPSTTDKALMAPPPDTRTAPK